MLSSVEAYSQSVDALNLQQLDKSSHLLALAEKEIATNFDHLLNLRIFLMNRRSIILKLQESPQLAECLRQLFFFNVAYKGYLSPDTNKHLSNALLASIYSDRRAALALVEHLRDEPELSPMCRSTLSYFSSIVYALNDGTISKALGEITQVEETEDNRGN